VTDILLPLPHRRAWFWLSVVLLTGVIVMTLMPGDMTVDLGKGDKLAHGTTYLVLAVWFTGVCRRESWPWVATGLLLLGFVLELAQFEMHMQRVADPSDMAANAVGVATGMLIAFLGAASWAQRLETWLART
jgi:hypothetical protein